MPTQELIDRLAERIERAYSLRRPRWRQGCSTRRVWNAAAHRLWQVHEENPREIPLDPELYVAAQMTSGSGSDPWVELTEATAGSLYRSQVYKIIDDLHSDLKREIRSAERAIRKGREISKLLKSRPGKLSHLGCYIVARRAGRADLAERFADAAITQQQSCPLYRTACIDLIPADACPAGTEDSEPPQVLAAHLPNFLLSRN